MLDSKKEGLYDHTGLSGPIYEQVISRFQELMLTGALEKDSQLPSVRSLAMELSINPNTIQRAYAELERQGYIYSIKGKGSFVADNGHGSRETGSAAAAGGSG